MGISLLKQAQITFSKFPVAQELSESAQTVERRQSAEIAVQVTGTDAVDSVRALIDAVSWHRYAP